MPVRYIIRNLSDIKSPYVNEYHLKSCIFLKNTERLTTAIRKNQMNQI